jgi:uncharacterized membrane protein YiaA
VRADSCADLPKEKAGKSASTTSKKKKKETKLDRRLLLFTRGCCDSHHHHNEKTLFIYALLLKLSLTQGHTHTSKCEGVHVLSFLCKFFQFFFLIVAGVLIAGVYCGFAMYRIPATDRGSVVSAHAKGKGKKFRHQYLHRKEKATTRRQYRPVGEFEER